GGGRRFFFSRRGRHTSFSRDWSSDVCSPDLSHALGVPYRDPAAVDAPGATDEPPYPVTVEDSVGCDRFATRLVRGIDPGAASPRSEERRVGNASGSRGAPEDGGNHTCVERPQ